MDENNKKLVVIDGNALVHRAFHALPPMSSSSGEPVNAVYGFLLVFLKALKDIQPDFVVATFDLAGPTFRKDLYKEYKAKRKKAPDELYSQLPIIKNVLRVFGVPIFEKQGFEADDVIGTIAKLVEKQESLPKTETIIVTGDLDALALVSDQTKVYTLKKGLKDIVIYNRDLVMDRYDGLAPDQLDDFRGLRGDSSDNIPGVPGIGEKTAIQLLKEFKSIENLYSEIEKGGAPLVSDRIREKLKEFKEQAFLSKKLAEINFSVPIDFNLEDCSKKVIKRQEIIKLFQGLGFYSLIKRLPEQGDVKLGKF
ncbi:MAG: 5'-3' exonuclease H3TH domain-containing protein [Patescibacteria group bacterium]|nr:5'-3' exonuclease H3TH domain-containing protein [Patescibacteria group bacterium]